GSIILTGVLVSIWFALTAAILAIILAPRLGYSGEFRFILIFIAIELLVLTPFRLPTVIFQVDLRQWQGVGVNLVRQVVWLIALGLLVLAKANFVWVILIRLLCATLEAGLALVIVLRRN